MEDKTSKPRKSSKSKSNHVNDKKEKHQIKEDKKIDLYSLLNTTKEATKEEIVNLNFL